MDSTRGSNRPKEVQKTPKKAKRENAKHQTTGKVLQTTTTSNFFTTLKSKLVFRVIGISAIIVFFVWLALWGIPKCEPTVHRLHSTASASLTNVMKFPPEHCFHFWR